MKGEEFGVPGGNPVGVMGVGRERGEAKEEVERGSNGWMLICGHSELKI